jgi:hypothetical protein
LLSRASRHLRLNEKLSLDLDPEKHHTETPSHLCSTGCDKENNGED